jgi:hypothetical protein
VAPRPVRTYEERMAIKYAKHAKATGQNVNNESQFENKIPTDQKRQIQSYRPPQKKTYIFLLKLVFYWFYYYYYYLLCCVLLLRKKETPNSEDSNRKKC